MSIQSTKVGTWFAKPGTGAVNVPGRIAKDSNSMDDTLVVRDTYGNAFSGRVAYAQNRRAFIATLEAVIERFAFAMSVNADGVTVGTAADLSQSHLFTAATGSFRALKALALPAARAQVDADAMRLPPRDLFRALCSAVAALCGAFGAYLRRSVDDGACLVFTPTVALGSWSANAWTPKVAGSIADVVPEVKNENAVRSEADVVAALRPLVAATPSVRWPGGAPNAEICDVSAWIASALGFDFGTFAYECYWPDDVSVWMEGDQVTGGSLDNEQLVCLLRAVAEGDADCLDYLRTSLCVTPIPSMVFNWTLAPAILHGLGEGWFDTARLNAFIWAATNAALVRIAPYGLFALNPTYGDNSAISRLTVAHQRIARSYNFSIDYPLETAVTLDADGIPTDAPEYDPAKFLITWSAGLTAHWGATDARQNVLHWNYSETVGVLKQGRVQVWRIYSLRLFDFCAWVLSAGILDAGDAEFATVLSERLVNFGGGAELTWVSDDDTVFPDATFAIKLSLSDLMFTTAFDEYRTVGLSCICHEPATFAKSFSAEAPDESASSHGLDLAGLGVFPCVAALANGYAPETGSLSSFWRGSLTAEKGTDIAPSFHIPKSECALGEGAANESTVRTKHLDAARTDRERVNRAQLDAVEAANASNGLKFLTDRGKIKKQVNDYADIFPTAEEVRNSLPTKDDVKGRDTLSGWKDIFPGSVWLIFKRTPGTGKITLLHIIKCNLESPWDEWAVNEECGEVLRFAQENSLSFPRVDIVRGGWETKGDWTADLSFGGIFCAFDWQWKALKGG